MTATAIATMATLLNRYLYRSDFFGGLIFIMQEAHITDAAAETTRPVVMASSPVLEAK